ncbi:pyridoxamine 5'-phosphate oxidase family protein [Nonomuraea sediminis]|uniref:pyridoxamine 5'-phosphate oxidase family protein n=1 Tax=Nonomuraea sediminis TaxID=2835864 RepID=UPI001BDCF74E|nr:pyridoxamine 5'-phosphate oxidase family protein [Nonomuraea sediminis]
MSYHRGELKVQERAGRLRQAGSALRGIRQAVPEVASDFLAAQPMIVVGAADGAGRMWASLVTGAPGFLRTPDPRTLVVDTLPLPDDPLAEALAGPAEVGMIAIEPATRRRMRVNGHSTPTGQGFRVDIDQAISNCPKYLQLRTPAVPAAEARPVASTGLALTGDQQEQIRLADTFFVATATSGGDADASHRGGNPGFVEVVSPTRLRWPDYLGNSMFLTLGNLAVHPAAGLLVPGWDTGSTLQLTGTARTVWDPEQRFVEFEVEAVHETRHATRLRWSAPEYSRFNP